MNSFKCERRARWTQLAVLVAAIVVPTSVWARHENQLRFWLAQSGNGCIRHRQFVEHGTNQAFKLRSQAETVGTSNSGQCQVLNAGTKTIRGSQTLYLVMLLTGNKPSDPNDADSWFICDSRTITRDWSGTMIAELSYPSSDSPPCGAGNYALISCLSQVDTRIVSNGITINGSFSALDARRDCNVSTSWHPLIPGQQDNFGRPVVLWPPL